MMSTPSFRGPGRRVAAVVAVGAALVSALAVRPPSIAAQAPSLPALWQGFWREGSPRGAAKAADLLVKAGVSFEAAWAELKRGRSVRARAVG